jgi:LysR family transcriptional activator of nhaA
MKSTKRRFPDCLNELPMLLPTSHTASRDRIDTWLEQRGIRPRIVGEFEDSALLKTFGASGMGVFPVAEWVHEELIAHYAVKRMGPCEGVTEHFFAVGTEKKVQHPLVQRLLKASS